MTLVDRALVVLALLVPAASAAPAAAQSLHLGAKLGVSHAAQDHVLDGSSEPYVRGDRWGPGVGLVARLEATPWLALQGEVLYAEKGLEDGPFRMDMRYLELPLLVRLTAPVEVAGLRPMAFGGVAPAREVSCGGRTIPPELTVVSSPQQPIPLECSSMRSRRYDVGTVLGGGLSRRVGSTTLSAEARHTDGRRDIGDAWPVVDVRNRAWTFALEGTWRVGA